MVEARVDAVSRPIVLLPETRAASQAIGELEVGRAAAALDLLRRALSRRKPPPGLRDLRTSDIIRLGAHIERAIGELEHGDLAFALQTLRKGGAPPRQL